MRDANLFAGRIAVPPPTVVRGFIREASIGIGSQHPIGFGSGQFNGTERWNVAQRILPAGDAAVVGVAESNLVGCGRILPGQVWPSGAAPDVSGLCGIGFEDQTDGFQGVGAEAVGKGERMEIAATNGCKFVSRQNAIGVVGGVRVHADADLAKVADAIDFFRFFFGLRDAGQHHRGEDCDDRNHDEEFNQGESRVGA
jgi:hypothetical protein